MALMAEEIVDEWLNRQGYFTIRGIRLGVHELDLLALKWAEHGLECRHIEVQASVRPVSYLSKVPRAVQAETGRSPTSAKVRTPEELRAGVAEWIENKFELPRKQRLRERLAPGQWSRELVVHRLRHIEELDCFRDAGIRVHLLSDIVDELREEDFLIAGAGGANFVDLVLLEDSVPEENGR